MPGWLPCAPGKLPSLPRVSCPETLPSRLRQKARRRQATRAFCLKPGQNGPKTPTHRAWLEGGKARQGKLPSEKRSLVERLLSLPSGPSVLPQHNKSKRDRNLLRRSSEASGHLGFDLVEKSGSSGAGPASVPTKRKCREGTVNLIGSGRDKAHEGRSHEGLCPSGHAGDLGPGLKGLGPGGSVLGGGAVIAAEMEEIVDPVMGGEEALGLARRLEPLHLPLASSGRLVRILGSVIQALVPPVLDRGHHLSLGGAVAGQLVRDHHTRGPALLFQQLAEQSLGGLLVAPALDENVEHEAILVHCAPEPVLLSPDHQAHFVQVPLVSSTGEPAPDLVGERLAKLARLLAHGFMAHVDAAGGQHLFHHAKAERKAEVEPHGVADDLAWKAVAGVG